MRYNVDWDISARRTLAAIWIKAANRLAVTVAQDQIDRLLEANPLGNSKPVSEGLYAINVHPLRAVFEVDDSTKSVMVVSVGELA
jgi:mRNA-degrading endonuclease RelE of RelBE toxin-antitoxin system